jgi:hypothetical protein
MPWYRFSPIYDRFSLYCHANAKATIYLYQWSVQLISLLPFLSRKLKLQYGRAIERCIGPGISFGKIRKTAIVAVTKCYGQFSRSNNIAAQSIVFHDDSQNNLDYRIMDYISI